MCSLLPLAIKLQYVIIRVHKERGKIKMNNYTIRLEDFVTKLKTRRELEVAIQMTAILEDTVIDETSKTILSLTSVILDNEKALSGLRQEVIDSRNEIINGVELKDTIESLEVEIEQLESIISDLELEISSIDENAYEVEIARLLALVTDYEDEIEKMDTELHNMLINS